VHDLAELADLEPCLARERVYLVAMLLDLVLVFERLFQPLAESFDTRLSQSGSSAEPR
jgi:hypothetical protein